MGYMVLKEDGIRTAEEEMRYEVRRLMMRQCINWVEGCQIVRKVRRLG